MFNRPYNMQKLIVKNRKEQNQVNELGFKIAPGQSQNNAFRKPGVRKGLIPHSTKNASSYKLS
jgi:hypothetical protein